VYVNHQLIVVSYDSKKKVPINHIDSQLKSFSLVNFIVVEMQKQKMEVFVSTGFQEGMIKSLESSEYRENQLTKQNQKKNFENVSIVALARGSYPDSVGQYDSKTNVRIDGIKTLYFFEFSKYIKASTDFFDLSGFTHLQLLEITRAMKNNEILLNLQIVFDERSYRKAQFIPTFEENSFKILLPIPKPKSVSNFLFSIFHIEVAVLIVVSVLLMAIVIYGINKVTHDSSPTPLFFMISFLMFFGGQSSNINSRHPMKKLLIILMIMLSFLIGNMYQGEIVSMLTTTVTDRRLKSLDEVIQSNYKFAHVGDETDHQVLSRNEPKLAERIVVQESTYRKVNFSHYYQENLGVLIWKNDLDLFTKKDYLKSLRLHDYNVYDLYYEIPLDFGLKYNHFMIAKRSLLTDKLREFNLRSFEADLDHYWNIKARMLTHDDDNYEHQTQSSVEYLMLSDLWKVFMILLIGYTISIITFVIENIVHKASIAKQQKSRKVINVKQKKYPVVSSKSAKIISYVEIDILNCVDTNEKIFDVCAEYDEAGNPLHGTKRLKHQDELVCIFDESENICGFIKVEENQGSNEVERDQNEDNKDAGGDEDESDGENVQIFEYLP
jgi:hypothetical protein